MSSLTFFSKALQFSWPASDLLTGEIIYKMLKVVFKFSDWGWKPDGCETQIDQNNVTCLCDHTTPFAVLLVLRHTRLDSLPLCVTFS